MSWPFFIAGCISLIVTGNFFRLSYQAPAEAVATVAVKTGAAKCLPSGALMGVSKDELLAQCGEPRSINHQIVSGGQLKSEQWSYRDPVFYVYLQNDRVNSIQYAENGQNFEWKN